MAAGIPRIRPWGWGLWALAIVLAAFVLVVVFMAIAWQRYFALLDGIAQGY
ncbi:MAG TPA: hypothetical protein VEI97_16945 [bacterium]|nr:hypothetical protein [bacterium]